ncbi:B12-binding domain-containing radical SAM protein [Roseateles amylovorans]|uniref:B12-binding domain-containing radical SAM protein n=1 Tax=Roseateles amylovorans TaxID=2978473 RepID=A0ABY6AXS8_9BURK|nr:radical SAM protein [Roseateles amylovorans]UXH76098.1 B12-binding domain-containing radical SAM protein [Roseateles amylovorans]
MEVAPASVRAVIPVQSLLRAPPVSSLPPTDDEPIVNPLRSPVDFTRPRPMRVCFPVLLDGDLVMSSEHLGVSYLVSILRDLGSEVRIIEVASTPTGDVDAIEAVAAFAPDLIGLSLTTVTVSHATAFCAALRERLGPAVAFLAGGPLATFLGTKLLSNPHWGFLDALVRGEGDVPLVRYVEAFWTDRDYRRVPSLSWRNEHGQVIDNLIGSGVPELDMLPEPARDQFEMNGRKLPYLRLATSRGCSARCTFCNAPHAGNKINPGKLWRARSPECVVDEIERLYRTYQFNTFDFVDSTFEDPGGAPFAKQRIAEIAQGIIDRDLKIFYNCCMQAKNWREDDRPLLELLYRSGLEKVLIGIESGSQRGLDRWKKKSTVTDNKRAIDLLRSVGVYVAFGFIAYHPWSAFDEIRENNQFLLEYMGYNLRRYTVRLELYPGAEAVELLRQEGKLHADFDVTLNPLSYDFHDERIQTLSRCTAMLYGERYAEEAVIGEVPAVFEFETYDIVLHTYMSRLRRFFGADARGAEILDATEAKAAAVRQEMSRFNFDLISEMTDLAEAGALTDAFARSQQPAVEAFYRERLKRLRQLQLGTSMQLHRAGLPVRNIQFSQ